MGGLNDRGSGELVSEQLERNIKIRIEAKAKMLSYLRSGQLTLGTGNAGKSL